MNIKKLMPALIPLAAAPVVYLLWPLKSSEFRIKWNQDAIDAKHQLLSSMKNNKNKGSLPNVLLIVADDLGVNDISFFGNGKVNTPNIDGIGHAGVGFRQAYTASPLCSPSRASILTGMYPQRYGFEFQMHDRYLANRLEYYGFRYFIQGDIWRAKPMEKVPRREDIDRQGLPPDQITIADLLKTEGYSTGIIGKWHTGWQPENMPKSLGFDEQYGFFDAHTLYSPIGTEGVTDQRIEKDFTDKYNWKLARKGWHGIFRNYQRIEEKEYLTDAITRESTDFIRKHKEGPFFLMVAYNAPHTPLQAPDEYVKMFSNEPDPVKRVYYAMIKKLDDDVGKLMDLLTSEGLDSNTLVIFLSDNGAAAYTFATDNKPLRGGKITNFEGGIRIPMFVRWPGKIDPGQVFDPPVITMDVFPTIAGAAGFPLPSDRTIDGIDLLRYVKNRDSIPPHPNLFWQRGSSRAIRSGDWKVIWNVEFGDTLLYNLAKDPDEINDLFPQDQAIARKLSRIHSEWSDSLPEPLWPPVVWFREKVDDRYFYFDD
jgi:arylsulfatase A-like enzyme